MNLKTINSKRLGDEFKSYKLDKDNIIDFLIKEDNDVNKYILKLYLISLLENYRHIDKLIKYIYLDNNFKYTPTIEIINRIDNKEFWNRIKDVKIQDNYNKLNWIDENLSIFIKLFINDFDSNFASFKKKIENEKNFINKLKLSRQLKFMIKKYKKNKDNIIISFNETFKNYITLDEFIALIKKSVNNLAKDDGGSVEEWLDSNFYFVNCGDKKIKNYLKIFIDEDKIVDFLKEDLLYNYKIIIDLFNEDIINENDLEKLIYKIRELMMNDDLYMKNLQFDAKDYYDGKEIGVVPINTNYRKMNLRHDTVFFSNSASIENIENEMSELFKKYCNIWKLEGDAYVLKCYEFVQDFLQIHPYLDGNGRTSKYLFYLLLFKKNILPFTITDDHTLTPCYDRNNSNRTSNENYVNGRNQIMVDRVMRKI